MGGEREEPGSWGGQEENMLGDETVTCTWCRMMEPCGGQGVRGSSS